MYLSMVCGMFVCVNLSVNVCMFTVLMSNATAIVRVGGMCWLKPVATYRDMPRPTEPVKRVCYADDLTVWATGVKIPDLKDSVNSYLR